MWSTLTLLGVLVFPGRGGLDLVKSGAQLQAELEQMRDADRDARRWMVATGPKRDAVIASKPPSEADVKRMIEVDR
jgi:hypothetical protein